MRSALCVLVLALNATIIAQTSRVAGTVVDSETGIPLARSRVSLTNIVGERSTVTTSEGGFAFDVAPGRYTLCVAHRDWGLTYDYVAPGADQGTLVVVGPDLDTSKLLVSWHAPAAIRGKIVDETGEPIEDASIELFREVVIGGRRRIYSMGSAESDDFGQYSWSRLWAGRYYLVADGAPWYQIDGNALGRLTDAGDVVPDYLPVYFPGTTDPQAAAPLVLRPGANIQADFTIRPGAGATVDFSCSTPSCSGTVRLFAPGAGAIEMLAARREILFNHRVGSIRPGRYIVRYQGPEGRMRKAIEIPAGKITVDILPQTMPSLTGTVTFSESSGKPRHSMFVHLRNEDTGETLTHPLAPDGSFSWTEVQFSRVSLFLSGEDGYFVAGMSVNGGAVKDGVIDVQDGAAIEVRLIASRETGRLSGVVKNGESPAPMVLAVLAPAPESTGLKHYFGFPTASDGSFDCPAVPVGEYLLFAVGDLDFEYANPEAVGPYLATAKRLKIASQVSIENVELPLTVSVQHK
jgi:hypothetical protein